MKVVLVKKWDNPILCKELLLAEVTLDTPKRSRSSRVYTRILCMNEYGRKITFHFKTKLPDKTCAMKLASCIEKRLDQMTAAEIESLILDTLAYALYELSVTTTKVTLRRSFNMIYEKIVMDTIAESRLYLNTIHKCVKEIEGECVYAETVGYLEIE